MGNAGEAKRQAFGGTGLSGKMAAVWIVLGFLCQGLEVSLGQEPSPRVLTLRRATSEFRRHRALTPEAPFRIDGVSWCLAACLRTDTCRAFNYGAHLCQLLDQDLCSESGRKLVPSPTLSYYDLMDNAMEERSGPLWSTPFCSEDGFCSPRCEPLLYLPRLNELCDRDFECHMRTGPLAVCRRRLCKCTPGYYIEGNATCEQLPAEGYSLFAGSTEGSYFKLSTGDANFTVAAEECAKDGATLAYVADGDTNRFLRELMRRSKVRAAYIGLTDEVQEGAWVWVANGQRLKTTQFWRPGAPDNRDDAEHCAQLSNEIDFGWDDVQCGVEGRFFCQLPHLN
ncbi:hypothetical protein HPB47_001160 [Ixodes persulcatus]|uniref:Uncharacterized protein n=1 Tax=Ixodes persulcatus TaxID=34615 RepID=A0AC60PRA8_IXOPE|nr:hypothetical protein HPB47_001160 [Ixodes persulcatus]